MIMNSQSLKYIARLPSTHKTYLKSQLSFIKQCIVHCSDSKWAPITEHSQENQSHLNIEKSRYKQSNVASHQYEGRNLCSQHREDFEQSTESENSQRQHQRSNCSETEFVQALQSKNQIYTSSNSSYENVHTTYFGHMRLDADNIPMSSTHKVRGEITSDDNHPIKSNQIDLNVPEISENFIENQYFEDDFSNIKDTVKEKDIIHLNITHKPSKDVSRTETLKKLKDVKDLNFFDKQLVENTRLQVDRNTSNKYVTDTPLISMRNDYNDQLINPETDHYLDKRFNGDLIYHKESKTTASENYPSNISNVSNNYVSDEISIAKKNDYEINKENDNYFDENFFGEFICQKGSEINGSTKNSTTVINDTISNHKPPKNLKSSNDASAQNKRSLATTIKTEADDPQQTAYDVVMQMRRDAKSSSNHDDKYLDNPYTVKWSGKRDSQGFKILSDQVMDLQNVPQDTIVQILKKSILYEDEQLVVINKPYGLPSHGGPGVHNSVGKVLVPLAQRISKDLNQLYMVHRLDKESTGTMLLAKNVKCADQLVKMFMKRQIIKKYLALTKGVPNPEEGVIDIPICEGIVEGKYRMALKPYYPKEIKDSLNLKNSRGTSGSHEAITNFRVLDSYGSAALVECQPETGVKHQIRCHLAFALNTPILGDHKYSHLSKIAPQKLSADMLQRLGVRQAKVRHISMHLHAASLVIPEFIDGKNLFISAKLPKHFVQNLKWLKLKITK